MIQCIMFCLFCQPVQCLKDCIVTDMMVIELSTPSPGPWLLPSRQLGREKDLRRKDRCSQL